MRILHIKEQALYLEGELLGIKNQQKQQLAFQDRLEHLYNPCSVPSLPERQNINHQLASPIERSQLTVV